MAPKPNGFLAFVLEYRSEHCPQAAVKDLTTKCGKLWDNMSMDQRQIYNNKAKSLAQGKHVKKLTSQGVPIDDIIKQEEENKMFEYNMRTFIKNCIRNRRVPIQSINFYVIHVNYFCHLEKENIYYPAEIAVARFNLSEGIEPNAIYHEICKPGPLPLGYAAAAKLQSDETHQLEPPDAFNRNIGYNLNEIFSDVISFLAHDCKKSTNELPPVYAISNNMEVVSQVLGWMCDNHGYPKDHLKVYSLPHLFFELKNATFDDFGYFPSIALAREMLERDPYEYTVNISCVFHETAGVQHYCSKSIVTRMTYIICEFCTPDLKIPVIPGQHIPMSKLPANKKKAFGTTSSDGMRTATSITSLTDDLDSCSVTSDGQISDIGDGKLPPPRQRLPYGPVNFPGDSSDASVDDPKYGAIKKKVGFRSYDTLSESSFGSSSTIRSGGRGRDLLKKF